MSDHMSSVSSRDHFITRRWPASRVIWSCEAAKGPLLTRYFLVCTPWFAVYLHHFHTSDDDRYLHDHPWSFVTWLMTGGYWERTATGRYWRRRFSLWYRPAEWAHCVEIDRPLWTLVLRFRRRRAWGFWTPAGWIGWEAYGQQYCD